MAENQSGCGQRANKNREMTRFTFSDYTARLREFIRDSSALISAKQFSSSAEFNDLAMSLFGLQFAFNQPYRQFCELRGVLPDQIIHWKQIPAISASAFKELDLTSLAPGERTTVFHSSGSTERKPSRHYHDAGSLSVYESSLLPWFEAHFGFAEPPSQIRMMILTPTPEQAPNSSLVHMFETVRREFGDPQSLFTGQVDASGAWVLDAAETQAELARAAGTNQPLAVLGTAFNFVHLLDHFAQGWVRFQLPSGSWALREKDQPSRRVSDSRRTPTCLGSSDEALSPVGAAQPFQGAGAL